MSLQDWLNNGWLRLHQTSREEIQKLYQIIERDLNDAQQEQVSEDWRFAIADNAARQCCMVALYCKGYRPDKSGGNEHYRTINSLTETMGSHYQEIRDYLDSCRAKRNTSDYDMAGMISKHQVKELIGTAQELYAKVRSWQKDNFPEYV